VCVCDWASPIRHCKEKRVDVVVITDARCRHCRSDVLFGWDQGGGFMLKVLEGKKFLKIHTQTSVWYTFSSFHSRE
jgi:hypothetical protein